MSEPEVTKPVRSDRLSAALEKFGAPIATFRTKQPIVMFCIVIVVLFAMGLAQLFYFRGDNHELKGYCMLGFAVLLAINVFRTPQSEILVCPEGLIWHIKGNVGPVAWKQIDSIEEQSEKRKFWRPASRKSANRAKKFLLQIHLRGQDASLPIDEEFYANSDALLELLRQQAKQHRIRWKKPK